MTFDMFSESVILKGDTPFSKCMDLAADCYYPIDRRKMVVGMVNLEGVLRPTAYRQGPQGIPR